MIGLTSIPGGKVGVLVGIIIAALIFVFAMTWTPKPEVANVMQCTACGAWNTMSQTDDNGAGE